jgi:four helix bundle protein
MAGYNSFLEIEIWKRARKYAERVWEITLEKEFTKDFSLKDQIRASSGSIMDNVAEGSERDGNKEYRQFLSIAKGSAAESVSQLFRAFDRKYISEADFNIIKDEGLAIARMIGGLMKHLNNTEMKGHKFK